jgi:hypothetical protein
VSADEIKSLAIGAWILGIGGSSSSGFPVPIGVLFHDDETRVRWLRPGRGVARPRDALGGWKTEQMMRRSRR